MEIRISVVNGDLADLESLDDWLRGEPELAGRVRLTGPPPREGELGGLAETILVDVGPAAGAIALALPAMLKAWLQFRGRATRLEIRLPNGTSFKIDTKRQRDGEIETLIRLILASGDAPSDTQAPTLDAAEE